MATSSLAGVNRPPQMRSTPDSTILGPSNTSDSGSDVAGLDDNGDPSMPLDAAVDPDLERPETTSEAVAPGIDSDAEGTGERRSAGSDSGGREAPDISPDRIVDVPDESLVTDDPLDRAATELIAAADAAEAEPSPEDRIEEEEEDEDADPVG